MPMEILTTTRLDAITTVVKSWGIADNWDVLLVGDGSGAGWKLPCAWGVTLIDRRERKRQWFYGGMNLGTINVAELMPYLQAMNWFAERRRRLANIGKSVSPLCRVHIVSDHKAIQDEGTALVHGAKTIRDIGANRAIWAGLLTFEWEGYLLNYHHIPSASVALNCWADEMASICFAAMKAMRLPCDGKGREVSPYECNPDDDRVTLLHNLEPKTPRPRYRKKHPRALDCSLEESG